jgi:hypothetical protein
MQVNVETQALSTASHIPLCHHRRAFHVQRASSPSRGVHLPKYWWFGHLICQRVLLAFGGSVIARVGLRHFYHRFPRAATGILGFSVWIRCSRLASRAPWHSASTARQRAAMQARGSANCHQYAPAVAHTIFSKIGASTSSTSRRPAWHASSRISDQGPGGEYCGWLNCADSVHRAWAG